MSDAPIGDVPVVTPPIQVNANPLVDQVATGLRYALLAVASIAGALGYSHVAGQASALLSATGTVAGLIVFAWGQLRTRQMSQKSAAMANQLPDSIAKTK